MNYGRKIHRTSLATFKQNTIRHINLLTQTIEHPLSDETYPQILLRPCTPDTKHILSRNTAPSKPVRRRSWAASTPVSWAPHTTSLCCPWRRRPRRCPPRSAGGWPPRSPASWCPTCFFFPVFSVSEGEARLISDQLSSVFGKDNLLRV